MQAIETKAFLREIHQQISDQKSICIVCGGGALSVTLVYDRSADCPSTVSDHVRLKCVRHVWLGKLGIGSAELSLNVSPSHTPRY
jgi:hypothetical protein